MKSFQICSAIRVSYITDFLARKGNALSFFYRPDELERYLNSPKIRSLIREYGYTDTYLERMLDRLHSRVEDFAKRGMGFPHEIGAFLGYPADDVKGFIENRGEQISDDRDTGKYTAISLKPE